MLEFKGYLEQIDTLIFREKASIQIPKPIREKAFSYRLDIEITSIARESYLNYGSIPAHSFYGYAVLVMRDHSRIQIPIEQSRQTLYFEKIYEAYVNWYALCFWLNAREYSKGLADLLGQIGTQIGLGTAVIPPVPCPEWSGFEEIQIREAYIKCPFGTQFKLESSYWTPIVQNGDTDCSYDAKSKQADGDKDDGLPPASAPQKASDPNRPYDGFPPPTSMEDLGNYWLLKDEASLNSPNPDNAADTNAYPPEGWGKFLKMEVEYRYTPDVCSRPNCIGIFYFLVGDADTEFSVMKTGEFSSCGQVIGIWTVATNSSGVIRSGVLSKNQPVLNFIYAPNKPLDTDSCFS